MAGTSSPSMTSSERLALLYQLSQTFNSSLDLEEVLNRVMDEVVAVTGAERGFVMLVESDSQAERRLAFKVARGMDQKTIEEPQFQLSRSTVERVAKEGKPILTSDAQSDERLNLRQSVVLLGIRSVLCVPLKLKERVLGVIYVDNRLQAGIFTHADLELLTAIAASAAIAIENARLYQVAVDKGRIERELQMAHRVQANLLPSETPSLPGWQFAALWQPAREVGGDYYDFIRLENGKTGLVIADVTDKGMPAALFMAFARSTVRASLDRSPSPSEGITRANHLICEDSIETLFVSLFYGCLDPVSGEFTYVNAGHNPPIYISKSSGKAEAEMQYLLSTGYQLGMESEAVYTQGTLSFQPGDFVVLYTDGVTDTLNVQGETFELERLSQVVIRSADRDASGIIAAVAEAIDEFSGDLPPVDDLTLMVIKREHPNR